MQQIAELFEDRHPAGQGRDHDLDKYQVYRPDQTYRRTENEEFIFFTQDAHKTDHGYKRGREKAEDRNEKLIDHQAHYDDKKTRLDGSGGFGGTFLSF